MTDNGIYPSVLAYARYHGIAIPLTQVDPESLLPRPLTPASLSVSLQDDDDLPSLDLDAVLDYISSELKEKISLSRESAALVSSIVKPALTTFETDLRKCCPPNIHASRKLKVDDPALITDHEFDTTEFRRVSLETLKIDLPLERVNVDNDEGLIFPRQFWDAADEIRGMTGKAKLDATKNVIGMIQQIRQFGAQNESDIWQECRHAADTYVEINRKKKKRLIALMTPPLLSRESSPQCYLPDSPTLRMPVLSQPETPVIPQHEQVQYRLAQDCIAVPPPNMKTDGRTEDRMVQASLLLDTDTARIRGIERTTSSVFPMTRLERKRRARDLKVEGPLTPPLSVKKRRHSDDASAEVRDIASKVKILADVDPALAGAREIDAEKLLDDELAQLAQGALEQVQNELNQEALRSVPQDTKLHIPEVTAVKTLPPWHTGIHGTNPYEQTSHILSKLLQEVPAFELWPITTKENRLDWGWLRGEATVDVKEDIPDNGSTREYLMDADEDGLLDYTGLLYQIEGIGLLGSVIQKHDERDIYGIIAARKQVNPTKRHNDHDDEYERLLSAKKRASEVKPGVSRPHVMVSTRATRTTHREKENVSGQPAPVPPESSSFQFSAGDSLASFMALRGKKPQTSKREVLHSVNKPNQIDISPQSHLQSTQSSSPEKKPITISIPATPNFPPPDQPLTLILSTALLKTHRHLIRDLELFSQSCHLIFRDYEDDHPRMPAHSADPPALNMQEADIILSPKTGIIISSLQETMQRYLPGHTPKHNFASTLGNKQPLDSPLKTKVAMAAARYEKLYVLICHTPSKTETGLPVSSSTSGSTPEHPSEGCNNTIALDERSHRAITTFSSFCAALSPHTSVTPVIVSPASARTMIDWVVGLANKSHKNMPWSLGEDLPLGSSQHEMVLRKAGLNTFAALFVLWWNDDTEMTKPTNQRQRTSESRLLARFVTMSSFERQEKFGDMLGRGLLKRAERAIEMIRREKLVCDA